MQRNLPSVGLVNHSLPIPDYCNAAPTYVRDLPGLSLVRCALLLLAAISTLANTVFATTQAPFGLETCLLTGKLAVCRGIEPLPKDRQSSILPLN